MNGRMAKRCRRAAQDRAKADGVLRSYAGTHRYSPQSAAWRYKRIKRAVTRHQIAPLKEPKRRQVVAVVNDLTARETLLNPSKQG